MWEHESLGTRGQNRVVNFQAPNGPNTSAFSTHIAPGWSVCLVLYRNDNVPPLMSGYESCAFCPGHFYSHGSLLLEEANCSPQCAALQRGQHGKVLNKASSKQPCSWFWKCILPPNQISHDCSSDWYSFAALGEILSQNNPTKPLPAFWPTETLRW